MATGTRNVRIFVSEQCFALLVDAMAAFSKKTGKFQTMRMTVQAACTRLKSHRVSRTELEQFLADYTLEGDIPVWLEVTPAWSSDYDILRERVKEIAGKQGTDRIVIPFSIYLAADNNLL